MQAVVLLTWQKSRERLYQAHEAQSGHFWLQACSQHKLHGTLFPTSFQVYTVLVQALVSASWHRGSKWVIFC